MSLSPAAAMTPSTNASECSAGGALTKQRCQHPAVSLLGGVVIISSVVSVDGTFQAAVCSAGRCSVVDAIARVRAGAPAAPALGAVVAGVVLTTLLVSAPLNIGAGVGCVPIQQTWGAQSASMSATSICAPQTFATGAISWTPGALLFSLACRDAANDEK